MSGAHRCGGRWQLALMLAEAARQLGWSCRADPRPMTRHPPWHQPRCWPLDDPEGNTPTWRPEVDAISFGMSGWILIFSAALEADGALVPG